MQHFRSAVTAGGHWFSQLAFACAWLCASVCVRGEEREEHLLFYTIMPYNISFLYILSIRYTFSYIKKRRLLL